MAKKGKKEKAAEEPRLKIIFTKEDRKLARKKIVGFRQSYIIDAREIILELDYEAGETITSPHDFIINKELEKKLAQALVNKKSQQIIYFHYDITPALIKNVKEFFKVHKQKLNFCIYDPATDFKKIHRMFNEVLS